MADDKKKIKSTIDIEVTKLDDQPKEKAGWFSKYGLRAIGFGFIFVGVLGLSFPFWPLQFFGDFAYINTIAQAQNDTGDAFESTEEGDQDVLRSEEHPEEINRLRIDTIGVNMPLIESRDVTALNKGGWIFPNTSTPDKGGNTVIFGHRFRYLPPISNTFYALDKINIGDTFDVRWNDEQITYKVTEIKTIEPTDWSVVEQTENPRITLITCAPLFSTRYRLVVVGEPVVAVSFKP